MLHRAVFLPNLLYGDKIVNEDLYMYFERYNKTADRFDIYYEIWYLRQQSMTMKSSKVLEHLHDQEIKSIQNGIISGIEYHKEAIIEPDGTINYAYDITWICDTRRWKNGLPGRT